MEQRDKQVKQALGWARYQVRSDRAIRRHWQVVCCAFSFCWWAAGQGGVRLRVSWPEAVRAVRAWLEPWMLLTRWWQAWSDVPPPPALRGLLDWLWDGQPLDWYAR